MYAINYYIYCAWLIFANVLCWLLEVKYFGACGNFRIVCDKQQWLLTDRLVPHTADAGIARDRFRFLNRAR